MATVTKSIGATGRDYSTITAWEADLDDGAIYASGDDAVGECYNDSAFDESVTIDGGGTVGLNGVTLTVASGERHDGTAGTGARITRGGNSVNAAVNVTVSWLEIDGSTDGSILLLDTGNAVTIAAHHLICHGTSRSAGEKTGVTTESGPSGVAYDIHNLIIYRVGRDDGTGGSEIKGFEQFVTNLSGKSVDIVNVTIHDVESPGSDVTQGLDATVTTSAGNQTVKNVVVTDVVNTGSGSAECFSVASGSTTSHNASSDATASGTGSLTNIITADQYVSTVSGSEDLHLKSGADCIDAGTDLSATGISGITEDIDGTTRTGTWDIGADEFEAAAGGLSIPVAMATYRRRRV